MSDRLSIHPHVDDLSLCADEIPILTACAQLPRLTGRCSRRFERYYGALAESFVRFCRVKLFPSAESEYRKAPTLPPRRHMGSAPRSAAVAAGLFSTPYALPPPFDRRRRSADPSPAGTRDLPLLR